MDKELKELQDLLVNNKKADEEFKREVAQQIQ